MQTFYVNRLFILIDAIINLKDDVANNTFIQNITGSNNKTIILLPFKIIVHRKKIY